MKTMRVSIVINGRPFDDDVDVSMTLLDFLRERLGLTGTKRGCEIGECGACTVLLDGLAVNSCLVPLPQINGRTVLTVEGLARGECLSPLQEAFLDQDAVHCGFCTPGMLMSARALLDRDSDPVEREIREAIAGNLCRCTGYVQIVGAIEDAARRERQETQSPRETP